MARATTDLAVRLGCEQARAFTLLGSALLIDGSPEWPDAISRCLQFARAAGDVDAEMEAANALSAAHLLSGDRLVARQVATEACQSARSSHRRHWEEQFGALSNLLAMIAGDIAEVAEWGRDEVGPDLSAGVQLAYSTYAVALADLGRQHLEPSTIDEGLAVDAGDATGASLLRWAEAEARWLLGQPEKALVAAEESLSCADSGLPVRPLAGALRAWCQYDLGLPVVEPDEDCLDVARAAKVESRGISLLGASDHTGAVRCFEDAADMVGDAPRFVLRARWGLGETWRVAGEPDRATAVLLDVHETARRSAFMALHGSAHRSLRRLGWKDDPGGLDPGPLTQRQSEVLALVGEGHTTREIASILGLRASTIDTHVSDAMAQLGATTRMQAALLARPTPAPTSRSSTLGGRGC